jgi:hypothetical protein
LIIRTPAKIIMITATKSTQKTTIVASFYTNCISKRPKEIKIRREADYVVGAEGLEPPTLSV